MNLTSKTPSNVRMSIKGNFSIETSGVLSVLDNVMNSRFIGLVKNFNPKKKSSLKEVTKIPKMGIGLIVSSKDT